MKKRRKSFFERITAAAGLVWLVSVSAINTESWIPYTACLLSTLWLGLYVYALNRRKERAHG